MQYMKYSDLGLFVFHDCLNLWGNASYIIGRQFISSQYPYADGTSPEILNANFNGPKLNITWTSGNTDIIKTEVFWENVYSNIRNSTIVEWYRKNVLVQDINSSISYNVTVVEHNKCEKKFKSNVTLVGAREMQLSTSPALKMSTVSVCNEGKPHIQ